MLRHWPNILGLLVLFTGAIVLPIPYFGTAFAAVELVGTTTASGTLSAYDMPLTALAGGIGSAPAAGDLVVVVNTFINTKNFDPGVGTAGYTEVADLYSNDSLDTNLSVDYKVMGSTPDTTVSCNGSSATADASVCLALVFRGIDSTTPLDVTATSITGTSAEDIDCPSTTPATSGALVVCLGGAVGGALPSGAFTWPSGYTEGADISSDPGNVALAVGAYTRWSGSGAEDPGAFALTMGTSGSDSWGAVTLALRPAAASAPTVSTGFTGNVSTNSANLFGTITSDGGDSITEYGFAYASGAALSSGVSTTTSGAGSVGEWNESISSLTTGTTYYYRAYAANSGGTGYGLVRSFTAGISTVTRHMRLFAGFRLKLIAGRIVLNRL